MFEEAGEGFRGWLLDRGLSENTARTYCAAVNGIWPNDPSGWLQRHVRGKTQSSARVYGAAVRRWIEYDGKDPRRFTLSFPVRKSPRRVFRPLTDGQLEAFLARARTLPQPFRVIFVLLPATGLRISEMCALRVSQLERRNKRVALVFRGKGDNERRVYLPRGAERELVAFLKSTRAKTTKTPWIFCGYKKSHLSPERVRQKMRELSLELGLRVTPHLLRHTFATRLHEKGNSLRVIQEALGHSSPKTTMRYVHPTDRELIRAADSVE